MIKFIPKCCSECKKELMLLNKEHVDYASFNESKRLRFRLQCKGCAIIFGFDYIESLYFINFGSFGPENQTDCIVINRRGSCVHSFVYTKPNYNEHIWKSF